MSNFCQIKLNEKMRSQKNAKLQNTL